MAHLSSRIVFLHADSGAPGSERKGMVKKGYRIAFVLGTVVVASQQQHMAAAFSTIKRGMQLASAAPTKVKTILGTMSIPKPLDMAATGEVLEYFKAAGHEDIDSAIMYQGGGTEEALGEIGMGGYKVASKANPWYPTTTTLSAGLQPSLLKEQISKSLANLKLDSCDLYYLHAPDHDTPIDDTLKALLELKKEGKFVEWGLSNFAAWQVVDIHHRCKALGLPPPSVYQGMYNAVTREVEAELLPALRAMGMSFYAYNPLAGGVLSGVHSFDDDPKSGRFNGDTLWGQRYRERFWHRPIFEAVEKLKALCEKHNTTLVSASLRWLHLHSALEGAHGDGVIIGGSSVAHCKANIDASVDTQPLPDDLLRAFDEAAAAFQPSAPKYFR